MLTSRHTKGATLRGVWWIALALGCASEPNHVQQRDAAPSTAALPPHQLTVCATDSLHLAVERLARAHEALHPGASVETVLGGGAALLARMDSGGRCDVVAVGDSSLMSRFTAAAHLAVGSPRELARNRLALVVASGNPAGIESLEDLRQPNLRIALGKRSASIGRYGRWVLSRIQPSPSPAVEADTARGVLDLVAEKRADVGVVYATTTGPGDPRVKQIALPEAQNTSVLYSISRARLTEVPQAADAFIALACGSEGAKILEGSGMEARAPAK